MKKRYIIHGWNYAQHPVKAVIDGAEQEVFANAMLVELTPENGVGSAIQLPVINPSEEELNLFSKIGHVLELTFAAITI